jgi:hypothetical protein
LALRKCGRHPANSASTHLNRLDVLSAFDFAIQAAATAGCAEETRARIRELVATESHGYRFVTKVLGRELGLH